MFSIKQDISDLKKCPTCSVVDAVCFWGEMPEEKWKRPFVLVTTILFELGIIYWIFFSNDPGADTWIGRLLALIIASFSGLGIASAIWGCDKCVAKVCGKAQT